MSKEYWDEGKGPLRCINTILRLNFANDFALAELKKELGMKVTDKFNSA